LKKPPGEGTGPTMHADFRGNLVGRVPSHGERDVFQQTDRAAAAGYFFDRSQELLAGGLVLPQVAMRAGP